MQIGYSPPVSRDPCRPCCPACLPANLPACLPCLPAARKTKQNKTTTELSYEGCCEELKFFQRCSKAPLEEFGKGDPTDFSHIAIAMFYIAITMSYQRRLTGRPLQSHARFWQGARPHLSQPKRRRRTDTRASDSNDYLARTAAFLGPKTRNQKRTAKQNAKNGN